MVAAKASGAGPGNVARVVDVAHIALGGLFLLAAVVWCFVAGKDLNFDFINYHLYGPIFCLKAASTGTTSAAVSPAI